jgi:hypothetical protein
MRNFQTLTHVVADDSTGIITLTTDGDAPLSAELSLRREGDYLSISASYGAFEIALRPRFGEFVRTLGHVQPIDGLNTSRQVGTGDAYLSIGLHTDGSMYLRPTILGDASGHVALNLRLSSDARRRLIEWLGAIVAAKA